MTDATIGFYGAMWDDHCVKVRPLSHIFNLNSDWFDSGDRHALASCLDALKDTIDVGSGKVEAAALRIINVFAGRKRRCVSIASV